ncbi:MAG: hypothetical protein R3C13_11080 [Hyphomonas sp.]|uniref:hypothetical protein n=1 Tax=Hyphomonas sp. TaxID=87 RepID=UPI003526DCE5
MTGRILTDWDASMAAKFGKELIVAHHNLHERPMFSNEGLARLLDTYPRDRLYVYTMDDERRDTRSFRRGTAGNLTGEQILDAVQRGRLWLNLRATNHHLKDYADLSDEMFGEFDALNGIKTMKRDVGVLISSPKARVFYHLDIPIVNLWQIKGEKTFWLYPTGRAFAADSQVEAIVLRETEEDIHYNPAFDARAQQVVLKPGMVANWPQTAPHRIDNGDCVNVSLSCEYMTFKALVHANALYANGAMRRWWGLDPSIENDGVATKYAKAALARGLKLFNSRKAFEKQVPLTFEIDLDAENLLRERAAA